MTISRPANAIDTNVLIRLHINDDPVQGEKVRSLFACSNVIIASTVLLESEWVMRAGYRLPRNEIESFFRSVLGLENVRTDKPTEVLRALDAYSNGLDFADALHLATAADNATENPELVFRTFDTRLRKRAAKFLPDIPIHTP